MNVSWSFSDASPALLLMFDSAVRAAVVLLCAAVLSLLLRRASAALRHGVWTCAVIGALLMPLLAVALPGLPMWRVLPRAWRVAPAAPATTSPPSVAPRQTSAPRSPSIVMDGSVPLSAPMPQITAPPSAPRPHTAWPIIVAVWAVGSAIALLPLMLGAISLARLRRRAKSIDDATCRALAASIGVNPNRIDLFIGPPNGMPMTWFSPLRFRHRLLLPDDHDWSPPRLRAVLLHELSHIKRRDCVTQWLAALCCAMYWFNPLGWLAARRMKIERERACDDMVLAAGSPADDYASDLLHIAAGPRARRFAALTGIAMARKSTLEGRLLAILDPKRSRKALTRAITAMLLVVTAAIVIPTAMLRAAEDADELPAATSPPHIATLSSGVTIELVGVGMHPSTDAPWWKPDGNPMDVQPYTTSGGTVFPSSNQIEREFMIRIGHAPQDPVAVKWRFDPTGSSSGLQVHGEDGRFVDNIRARAQSIPTDASRVDVQIGIAAGPWETLYSHDGRSSRGVGHSGSDLAYGVAFGKAMDRDGDCVITVSHDIRHVDVRIVAMDRDGNLHKPGHFTGIGASGFSQLTATFSRMTLDQIAEFHAQTRPYEWVEFRNVSLTPGKRTDVQIIDSVTAPTIFADTTDAVALLNGRESANQAPTASPDHEPAASLELRFAFQRGRDLDHDTIAAAIEHLQQHGPGAWRQDDLRMAWFEWIADEAYGAVVEAERGGRTYVLLHDDADHIMRLPADGNVVSAVERPDEQGQAAIYVSFDERAGERLEQLTGANLGRPMAVVINGKVLSAPTVHSSIRDSCVITGGRGGFSEEEITRWLKALQPLVVAGGQADVVQRSAVIFDPVVERHLLDVTEYRQSGQTLIDIDTGKMVDQPEDMEQSSDLDSSFKKFFGVMRERGVDALYDKGPSVHGLVGFDMVGMPIPAELWDAVIDGQYPFREFMHAATPGSPIFLSAKGGLPATFLIRTREGSMGILQIVAFTDDPKGVKIRYRLLTQPGAP
jgi:beta-lactamase regulating signal transducer with metallopeptidase domain